MTDYSGDIMELTGTDMENQVEGTKKKMPRQALGKGLSALIPSSEQEPVIEIEPTGKKVVKIEIASIRRNPHQPRMKINEEKLTELAESIKEKGIIQPIIVRKTDDGYELIAGERRTLAAKRAGFDMVPAIVYSISNEESLEFALIENIQRDDLNAMELANAYQMLMDEFNLTQEEVSTRVGKERASVANYLRLRALPEKVKQLILDGELSFGHARTLLTLNNAEEQIMLALLVVKEGLSVRECESLAMKQTNRGRSRKQKKNSGADTYELDYDIASLEQKLQERLGTKVKIRPKKKGGVIEIEYYTLDELDGILEALAIKPEGE
jgi:ParB family transcriptional regulator, chromosome partitioning protein